ncbi:KAP family P-loop NTPase fold protein [Pseudoalteromonas sp. SWN166]|uniref:KAP family P-loop NTPase fold protein n=1 Tax=Pseudoalteromonas sp. SWN166 TaxID=2792061 RepID=UPI001E5A63C0|nr:P-loop NTPase fold protein [Pseudoalteromonas sp. SWN166]
MYVELAQRNHPVVYIDVWESDFSNNPLAVICSELLEQIEYVFKEKAPNGKVKDKKNAKEKFNDLKSRLGVCLKYAESAVLFSGDPISIAATKAASKAIEVTPNFNASTQSQKYTETIQKNHIESIQAVKDIKEYLTYLSELIEIIYALNIPIVILIDELDRCRPNYAIEVLEVIKHFFETKGCTFLVATNTEVLEHSVKSIYGIDFDAQLYLRRFFDRKVSLPTVSLVDYLLSRNLDFDKYNKKNVLLYPYVVNQLSNINFFANLFKINKIELREVEQIINRFFAALDYAAKQLTASDTLINTVVLMVGLIEQHLDKQVDRNNTSNIRFTIEITNSAVVGAPLSSFIKSMFDCVSITRGIKCFLESGHTIFPEQRSMLRVQSKSFSNAQSDAGKDIANIISEMISFESNGNCNYWMWDDYQKIIELSGHIE